MYLLFTGRLTTPPFIHTLSQTCSRLSRCSFYTYFTWSYVTLLVFVSHGLTVVFFFFITVHSLALEVCCLMSLFGLTLRERLLCLPYCPWSRVCNIMRVCWDTERYHTEQNIPLSYAVRWLWVWLKLHRAYHNRTDLKWKITSKLQSCHLRLGTPITDKSKVKQRNSQRLLTCSAQRKVFTLVVRGNLRIRGHVRNREPVQTNDQMFENISEGVTHTACKFKKS